MVTQKGKGSCFQKKRKSNSVPPFPYHEHVGTLGGVESGLQERFPSVCGVLLVRLLVAEPGVRVQGIAERSVERRRILGRVRLLWWTGKGNKTGTGVHVFGAFHTSALFLLDHKPSFCSHSASFVCYTYVSHR